LGFQCTCSACSAHPSLTKESDARIKLVAELHKKLNDWTEATEATSQMEEALVSLYEQERMTSALGVAYKRAVETYASFVDPWNAA